MFRASGYWLDRASLSIFVGLSTPLISSVFRPCVREHDPRRGARVIYTRKLNEQNRAAAAIDIQRSRDSSSSFPERILHLIFPLVFSATSYRVIPPLSV